MTSITPFKFDLAEQSFEVRTILREGEPWFVAKDVADILEYSEASAMIRHLDDDESRCLSNVRVSSRNRHGEFERDVEMIIISESGLYHAIFASRKEEAKIFRRWVTSEVLPSIRKTGAYHADRWHTLEPIARDTSLASTERADFWTERVRLAMELPAFKDHLIRVGGFTAVQESVLPFILPFILGGRTIKGLPEGFCEAQQAALQAAKAMTRAEFEHCAVMLPKVRRALKEVGWSIDARNLMDLLELEENYQG